MRSDDPTSPEGDPFGPPAVPTVVGCLHCQEVYDSYLIEWRVEQTPSGRRGFWCCPTPDCGGKGFGFDILPVDPNYRDERGGWFHDDESDEDDSDSDIAPEAGTDRPFKPDDDEPLPW